MLAITFWMLVDFVCRKGVKFEDIEKFSILVRLRGVRNEEIGLTQGSVLVVISARWLN